MNPYNKFNNNKLISNQNLENLLLTTTQFCSNFWNIQNIFLSGAPVGIAIFDKILKSATLARIS